MPPKKTSVKKTAGKTTAKKSSTKNVNTRKAAPKSAQKTNTAKKPVVTTTPATENKNTTTVTKNTTKKSCCSSAGMKFVLFVILVLLGVSVAFNVNYYQEGNEKDHKDKITDNDDKNFDSTQDRVVVNGNVWQNLGLLVKVSIVTDSSCDTCADLTTETMKTTIQGAFPFGEVNIIDVAKEKAPAGVVAVPTIVIDNKIEESKIFSQIQPYLTKIAGGYEMAPSSLNIRSNSKIIDKSILPDTGDSDKLVIFEYSEFACPYCKRFATETWPVLSEKYGDQIDLKFRHFIVHPTATVGSVAAECARKLGGEEKFKEMHDALFRDQAFDEESILGYGEEIGLETEAYKACLNDAEVLATVQQTSEEGKALTVVGTPSFLIGDTIYRGALPADEFEKIIDAELN